MSNIRYIKLLYNFKAQCPNQDWEYSTALCEEAFSNRQSMMDYNETSRFYCCERKLPEECRPCSKWVISGNCTETCREAIEKTREECRSNTDKYESITYDDEPKYPEEGKKKSVICALKHLVQECRLPIENLYILLII